MLRTPPSSERIDRRVLNDINLRRGNASCNCQPLDSIDQMRILLSVSRFCRVQRQDNRITSEITEKNVNKRYDERHCQANHRIAIDCSKSIAKKDNHHKKQEHQAIRFANI